MIHGFDLERFTRFEGKTGPYLQYAAVRIKSILRKAEGSALGAPQIHSPEERKTQPGKRNVAILEVNPVGNYAVRLVFDDMHSTGIYSWDYFAELGRNRARKWQDYLDELAAKNLKREPPGRRH